MMTLYNPSRDRKLELLSPCPKGIAFSEENVYESVQATLDVSVIIPCYNSEDYLTQCLESVLKQNTSYKFEVIAINDGSIDRTEDILEKYKKKTIIYGLSPSLIKDFLEQETQEFVRRKGNT
ncbi:glycosyltransferase family 2 protein [Enterococcus lactis]|nr:glycosyltransferase family 2 protein [Enterococcus lactis]MDV5136738.1 glycosyltransferase family 2 protein [Enterococcus lactis]